MPEPSKSPTQVRASHVFKAPAEWIPSLIVVSILVFVMTVVYLGSVVDPVGRLHGLPVAVVNEDAGATVGSRHVDLGRQVAAGLNHSPAVTSRLSLHAGGWPAIKDRMDLGKEYAAIVIPTGFTASLLAISGPTVPAAGSPSKPTIELLENPRAGITGAALAAGVLQPALAQASRQIGQRLRTSGPNRPSTAVNALLSDPITVAALPYRPLPRHTALGLSAFYIAILTVFCGFLGGTIVHGAVDEVLGYGTTEIGPRWRLRQPMAISRWQTLLAKWAIAVPLMVILTGLMLLAAIAVLHMNAPHFWDLWLLSWFGATVVAVGTLVLFAALGAVGQLVALLFFVYLAAMATSGGTVPPEAQSGFYRFLANFDGTRQILYGIRSVLYLDARGAAGLTGAFVATALSLGFWVALGAAVTTWYDRKGLGRMTPAQLDYVDQAIRGYREETGKRGDTGVEPS